MDCVKSRKLSENDRMVTRSGEAASKLASKNNRCQSCCRPRVEKSTSITSSLDSFSLGSNTGRQISQEDVFKPPSKRKPSSTGKENFAQTQEKTATDSIVSFLSDELSGDAEPCQENSAVVAELIPPPVDAKQEEVLPDWYDCVVYDRSTSKQWSGTRRVRASMSSSAELKMWRLASDVTNRICYVFGLRDQPGKYFSAGDNDYLKVIDSSDDPTGIDVDNGQEINDSRCFYWKNSNQLVPAMYSNLALSVVEINGRSYVKTIEEGSETTYWDIDY
ncbi:uncharacterized protein LOC143469685 [Clavelina lepadiformis]|uniref:uncharacterized protein LOC143469685 n=1 Tax=Clavelina lepadiformis TaxID=159417 RepID=UPI0040416280